jgi:hypothetical protein
MRIFFVRAAILGSKPLLLLHLMSREFAVKGGALKFLQETPPGGRAFRYDFFTPFHSKGRPDSGSFRAICALDSTLRYDGKAVKPHFRIVLAK